MAARPTDDLDRRTTRRLPLEPGSRAGRAGGRSIRRRLRRPRPLSRQPAPGRPRPEPDLPRNPADPPGGAAMTTPIHRSRPILAPASRRWSQADASPVSRYTQGALALTYPLPAGLEAEPRTSGLTLVTGERVAADDVPDVHPWATRFVQAVLEVVSSDRPLTQLARWTVPAVYTDLGHRRERVARHRRAWTGPGVPAAGRLRARLAAGGRLGRGGRAGHHRPAVAGRRGEARVRPRPLALHRSGARLMDDRQRRSRGSPPIRKASRGWRDRRGSA